MVMVVIVLVEGEVAEETVPADVIVEAVADVEDAVDDDSVCCWIVVVTEDDGVGLSVDAEEPVFSPKSPPLQPR